MRYCFRLRFLIGLSLGLGCSHPNQDEPIAQINGRAITVKDYWQLFDNLKPKELVLAGHDRREIKNLVVKTLIRRAVILSEAESRHITLTNAEVEKRLSDIKSGYTGTSFRESLLEQMVDETEWKEQVRQNLLIEKIFDSTAPRLPKPSIKEALQYFQENQPEFHRNARAVALQIVVADENVAKEIEKKLKSKPLDFLTLAKAHSIGPEAQEDAKIEIEKDAMPIEMDRALFESKLGKITPIIKTPYGFHIFKVLERHPSLNRDFDEVESEINARLNKERRKDWILKFEEKLIRSANISYNRKLIETL